MLTLTLSHFLILGAILFAIAVVGIFLNRKNLIVLFRNLKSIHVDDLGSLKG